MTNEAQTLLQYEPALQWLVDHPGAYPRAVAKRHDLDVTAFILWYSQNGPIASDARIRELKIEAGLLTDGEAPPPENPPVTIPAAVALPEAPKKQRYWSRRPKTPATPPLEKIDLPPGKIINENGKSRDNEPAPERRPWSTPEIRELKPDSEPVRVKLIVDIEVRVRTVTS